MEDASQAVQLIRDAKNVCIIPAPTNEPDSLSAALALFYTLRELQKNVNLIADHIPQKLQYLVPSLEHVMQPKHFIISIPRSSADVSQIYYEKNEESLKIHLTVDSGRLNKETIALYVEQPKPDLVITFGIQDFQQQLAGNLDPFGYILGATIINIDNQPHNKQFGAVNIISESSLCQTALDIINSLGEHLVSKEAATCLLSGIISHHEHFSHSNTSPQALQSAAALMQRGADWQAITQKLASSDEKELEFLRAILQHMEPVGNTSIALLDMPTFEDYAESAAGTAVQKLKSIGLTRDLLVLWKSHNSTPAIKGFFYSQKPQAIQKMAAHQGKVKNGWVMLSLPVENLEEAKKIVLPYCN